MTGATRSFAGAYTIGVDLGGTRFKSVAVTSTGEELTRAIDETDDAGDRWGDRIRARVCAMEREIGAPAAGVGISAPGLAATGGRSIAWMQGRLQSLQGLDWTDFMRRGTPVPVLNDAHAALLGESWRGAAAGIRNVVLLTLGTGVGGGAMVNGHLLAGSLGRGGHFGHISLDPDGCPDIVGTPGSLEDAIGDCTVASRSGGRFTSTERLVAACRAGDEEARRVWLRSVQHLACGLASLINILDPEVIVIAGGLVRAGDELFGPLRRFLEQYEWRPFGTGVPVVPAVLEEFAGAFGAARHALTSVSE